VIDVASGKLASSIRSNINLLMIIPLYLDG
jgi:hypothetical protein